MKKYLALVLAAIMLVAVVGCTQAPASNDGTTPPNGSSTENGQGSTAGAQNIATRDNNILTVATRGAIAGMFHPDFSVTSGQDRIVCFVLYEPLVRLGANSKLKGVLAESWEISEDQRTITFHLRQGVKWHDGEEFTAEDVKYTYTAAASEGWMGFTSPLARATLRAWKPTARVKPMRSPASRSSTITPLPSPPRRCTARSSIRSASL